MAVQFSGVKPWAIPWRFLMDFIKANGVEKEIPVYYQFCNSSYYSPLISYFLWNI
jgi:hypothetical protein